MGLCMMLKQRLELKTVQKLALRLALLEAEVEAECPNCGRGLTEDEVRAGWLNDPHDYTTKCPGCATRFVASLVVSEKRWEEQDRKIRERWEDAGGDEDELRTRRFQYLCGEQLHYSLLCLARGKSRRLGKVFLVKNHPELFWNMYRHHSSYEKALKQFRGRCMQTI